jgi:hypothetical protein
MKSTTISALKKSFFITLIYVGIGTICVLFSGLKSPQNEFIDGVMTFIMLITIPVTCISFGIMYSSPNYSAVLIVQSVVFLLFWLIAFLILNRKRKTTQTETSSDYLK